MRSTTLLPPSTSSQRKILPSTSWALTPASWPPLTQPPCSPTWLPTWLPAKRPSLETAGTIPAGWALLPKILPWTVQHLVPLSAILSRRAVRSTEQTMRSRSRSSTFPGSAPFWWLTTISEGKPSPTPAPIRSFSPSLAEAPSSRKITAEIRRIRATPIW